MSNLDTILDRHHVPQCDRKAFRALVDRGIRPNTAYRAKLRGPYAAALAEVRRALTAQLGFVFPKASYSN